jgi:nucleoside-diphosphate-sugar epimerase
MKILVTGASGFIGHILIPRLIKSGHEVVATSRNTNTNSTRAVTHPIAELGPDTDWGDALSEVEAVIHLAARVHVMSDNASDPIAEYRRINTEGTAKLARDSAKAGVRHFIFMSTIKVNGESSGLVPFNAHDIPAPKEPYAIAKLEAEEVLLGIVRYSNMQATIIRPPLVYGPGVKGHFVSLLKICGKGWPLPIDCIDNRRSIIYVGNLVDMVHRLIEAPPSTTGVYLCRDPQDVSTPELFQKVSAALGVKPLIVPFPLSLLRLSAAIIGKSAIVSRLTESLYVDDGPTRNDLSWTPPFSMLQGLEETATWFQNRFH